MIRANDMEKVVEVAAEAVNVGYKIVKGASVLSALALTDELSALSTLDKKELLSVLKSASKEQRKAWEKQFADKLDLTDDVLEGQIEAGVEILNEGVTLVLEAIDVLKQVKALVEKAKNLGSVPLIP